MIILYLILYTVFFFMLLVYVHETGHYIMGRAIGIPKEDLKINLTTSPPHVAIKNDGVFLSPDDPGYVEAYFGYDPDGRYAYRYVGAGFHAQTLLSLVLFPVLVFVLHSPTLALILVGLSLFLYLTYLAASFLLTTKTKTPWGDFGAMWEISKKITLVDVTVTLLIKLSLLGYAIALL